MDYKKIYNNLCESRKSRGVVREVGYEVHHIIPRSFVGSDDATNLVKLTYREHLLAHILLFKFSEGDNKTKMGRALNYLAKDCGRLKSSKAYHNIKIKVRDSLNSQGMLVLHVPTDSHEFKGIYSQRGRISRKDLRALGFSRRKLCDKSIKSIKILVNSLCFAYENGYDSIRGLKSISSYSMCDKLINSGMMVKFKKGRITYYKATEKGYKFFKSSTLKPYSNQFFLSKYMTKRIKALSKWNKENPQKLVMVLFNRYEGYSLKRLSSWDYGEFSSTFGELTHPIGINKPRFLERLDKLL